MRSQILMQFTEGKKNQPETLEHYIYRRGASFSLVGWMGLLPEEQFSAVGIRIFFGRFMLIGWSTFQNDVHMGVHKEK
jgi:hypothetical protein